MVPGKIKIPHIPPVQRSRAVILQDGVRRFVGHDIIAATDQLPQFVVYGFQPFCGSHHPVTHRGGGQAHTLAFKDFQLLVQGRMVMIFGRSNMSQHTFRSIAVRMRHHGHGSGYNTPIGKLVFGTDDADNVEPYGTDGIPLAHFFPYLHRPFQAESFRHGYEHLFPGKGRVNGLACMRSDLTGEAFAETTVGFFRLFRL